MAFGFGSDINEKTEIRRARNPLSDIKWNDIKIGMKVRSILTNTLGEVTSLCDPRQITIVWKNGRVSKFEQYKLSNVDICE